jgi:hypothetical protein
MNKLVIKSGTKLSPHEISQINQAKAKEFKAPPLQPRALKTAQFFLLLDDDTILALGELIPVEPVKFSGETFSILGVGGILASEKGKGYGKKIMAVIKDYLVTKNKTGVGFCALRNKGFYEKCGFNIDTTSIKRFVFQKGNKKTTNSEDGCLLYLDSSDHFMKKVLLNPDKKVILPRPPDW